MHYRVWDTDINHLFGTYDSEEDALALVRTLVSQYGKEYAADLAVGGESETGAFTQPLTGAALLSRAEDVAVERERAENRPGRVIGSRAGSGGSSRGYDEMAAKGGYSSSVGGTKQVTAPGRGTTRRVRKRSA